MGAVAVRILVTGATGLVGNNCLRQLIENGHRELSVLVRTGYDERPFESLDANLRHCIGDLSKPQQLADAIPDVDVIVHAAADTHIGKRPRPIQQTINVDATSTIAEIAHQRNCRFVFVSSVDALPAGSPVAFVDEETQGGAKYPCGYVETKRAAEAAVLEKIEAGLDGYIVNPGFMLGPWDWKPSSGRMLIEVATKFTPFGPWGGFSVCDIRDVAAAICKLAVEGQAVAANRRYILAGNNIRYIDAWRIFAEVSGGSKPLCPAGPMMKVVAGRWGDFMASVTGREGDVNSAGIAMSDLYHYYDSSRAKRELGYQVRPVQESAEAAWEWFQQHGYV